MSQTYAVSQEQQAPVQTSLAPQPTDYGSNSEQARPSSQAGSSTPFLDAAAGETPAPLGGAGLLGGLTGCASTDPIDAQVDAAISGSPRLLADVATVRTRGFHFERGVPGGGTYTVDPRIVVDPNEIANPLRFERTLAHEVGHALDGRTQYDEDPSLDRKTYIDVNTRLDLEGEAHATIEELEVRDDSLAHDPTADPGVTGATAADKIAAWEAYRAQKIDRATLIDRIVQLFATREKPSDDPAAKNYWDFYAKFHADAWDAAHPAGP